MTYLGIGALILVAFTLGYRIIGWLFDRLKQPQAPEGATAETAEEPRSRWGAPFSTREAGGSHGAADGGPASVYEDPETRYARVLGLPRNFTAPEIKERYRMLLASYHSDKFARLAPELQQMASQKTREIVEAYEYFRVKYNVK